MVKHSLTEAEQQTQSRVTILDLAEYLDISHSTVSRALSGSDLISEETRERVSRAAQELGYVANSAARTIRGMRSKAVGLVIPDISNDFYAQRIVADQLAQKSMQMILSVTDDSPERESRELLALIEARPSGRGWGIAGLPTSAARTT